MLSPDNEKEMLFERYKYSSQKHSSYYFSKVIIVYTLYTLKKSFDVHKL